MQIDQYEYEARVKKEKDFDELVRLTIILLQNSNLTFGLEPIGKAFREAVTRLKKLGNENKKALRIVQTARSLADLELVFLLVEAKFVTFDEVYETIVEDTLLGSAKERYRHYVAQENLSNLNNQDTRALAWDLRWFIPTPESFFLLVHAYYHYTKNEACMNAIDNAIEIFLQSFEPYELW
jgi:hypothetical protein